MSVALFAAHGARAACGAQVLGFWGSLTSRQRCEGAGAPGEHHKPRNLAKSVTVE